MEGGSFSPLKSQVKRHLLYDGLPHSPLWPTIACPRLKGAFQCMQIDLLLYGVCLGESELHDRRGTSAVQACTQPPALRPSPGRPGCQPGLTAPRRCPDVELGLSGGLACAGSSGPQRGLRKPRRGRRAALPAASGAAPGHSRPESAQLPAALATVPHRSVALRPRLPRTRYPEPQTRRLLPSMNFPPLPPTCNFAAAQTVSHPAV